MAPLYVGAQRLLLLWDVEIDDIRDRDGAGEDQARAFLGDVADQAIGRRAAIVEIDATAQEAFFARGDATLDHAGVPGLVPSQAQHTAARLMKP